MRKKSKTQKAKEAWKRLYDDLLKHQDLERFQEKCYIYSKIYGEMDGLLFYTIRHYIFHEIIIPKWMSSTNINNRKNLYNLVKKTLGNGLANELQLISSVMTW